MPQALPSPWIWVGHVPRDSGTGDEARPNAAPEVPPPHPVNPVRGVARLLEPLVLLPSARSSHKEMYPPAPLLEASGPGFAQLSLHPGARRPPTLFLSLGGWRPPIEPRALRAQGGSAPGAEPRQLVQCGASGEWRENRQRSFSFAHSTKTPPCEPRASEASLAPRATFFSSRSLFALRPRSKESWWMEVLCVWFKVLFFSLFLSLPKKKSQKLCQTSNFRAP